MVVNYVGPMDTNTAAQTAYPTNSEVITNTSAVATIDGDHLNTIHASDMADTLASYQRSTALVVDTSDLHALRRLLATDDGDLGIAWDQDDAKVAARLLAAIAATLDAGLR